MLQHGGGIAECIGKRVFLGFFFGLFFGFFWGVTVKNQPKKESCLLPLFWLPPIPPFAEWCELDHSGGPRGVQIRQCHPVRPCLDPKRSAAVQQPAHGPFHVHPNLEQPTAAAYGMCVNYFFIHFFSTFFLLLFFFFFLLFFLETLSPAHRTL